MMDEYFFLAPAIPTCWLKKATSEPGGWRLMRGAVDRMVESVQGARQPNRQPRSPGADRPGGDGNGITRGTADARVLLALDQSGTDRGDVASGGAEEDHGQRPEDGGQWTEDRGRSLGTARTASGGIGAYSG